ncbi:MAG: hypothetical protein ACLFOY_06665 [Desulfatibacillaceae bacterium]
MKSLHEKADALKKLTVELTAGSGPGKTDIISEPERFEFIFAVATEGMTLFEQELLEKEPGEVVEIRVEGGYARDAFEHLEPDILNRLPKDRGTYIGARLVDVDEASDREIVQALAKATGKGQEGCGCGGGCGCS